MPPTSPLELLDQINARLAEWRTAWKPILAKRAPGSRLLSIAEFRAREIRARMFPTADAWDREEQLARATEAEAEVREIARLLNLE